MARYLISIPSDAMDQIPEDEMPDVAKAAHAVCQEAIHAGVYVLAGGLEDQPADIVATDGTVTDGPKPDVIGGVTIVDVPSRQEALIWAGKVAAACRCPQEVPGDRIRPRTRGVAQRPPPADGDVLTKAPASGSRPDEPAARGHSATAGSLSG